MGFELSAHTNMYLNCDVQLNNNSITGRWKASHFVPHFLFVLCCATASGLCTCVRVCAQIWSDKCDLKSIFSNDSVQIGQITLNVRFGLCLSLYFAYPLLTVNERKKYTIISNWQIKLNSVVRTRILCIELHNNYNEHKGRDVKRQRERNIIIIIQNIISECRSAVK